MKQRRSRRSVLPPVCLTSIAWERRTAAPRAPVPGASLTPRDVLAITVQPQRALSRRVVSRPSPCTAAH